MELIDQGEGGDTQAHKDVAEGEADDEDVAHAVEAAVHQDGQNHQAVPKHGGDNDQDSENGDENVNGSTYKIISKAVHRQSGSEYKFNVLVQGYL